MPDSEKAKLLDWLLSKATGDITVHADGSREPQITWDLGQGYRFKRGLTPLEALQNAYEAEANKPA